MTHERILCETGIELSADVMMNMQSCAIVTAEIICTAKLVVHSMAYTGDERE